MNVSQVLAKSGASNSPSSRRNFIRLIDARLHAESSRNMYSEHGLLALIRSVFGQVCQSFTVVSNCIPGSPHTHVPSEIIFISSRALYVSATAPDVTSLVCQSPS